MKPHNLTEEEKNLIINAAYDDVSLINKLKVLRIINKNDEAKKLFEEYRNTALLVKKENDYTLSDETSDRIKSRIGLKSSSRTFKEDLFSLIITRPAISAVAVVLVAVTITTSLLLNNKREINHYNYSNAEVERAELQARQALVLVSSILNNTTNKISKEVLTNKVSKEINKGITQVSELLTKGDKNEN